MKSGITIGGGWRSGVQRTSSPALLSSSSGAIKAVHFPSSDATVHRWRTSAAAAASSPDEGDEGPSAPGGGAGNGGLTGGTKRTDGQPEGSKGEGWGSLVPDPGRGKRMLALLLGMAGLLSYIGGQLDARTALVLDVIAKRNQEIDDINRKLDALVLGADAICTKLGIAPRAPCPVKP